MPRRRLSTVRQPARAPSTTQMRFGPSPSLEQLRGGQPRRVRLIAAGIGILLFVVVLEGASYAVAAAAPHLLGIEIRRRPHMYREHAARARLLAEAGRSTREVVDSLLGWRYRARYSRDGDIVSEQGLRSSRVYDSVPTPGMRRVAAFGDSFVYGSEVPTRSAWPALAELAADRTLEVLNMGVGGYGVDQAYLRFASEAKAWSPHVALMGFTPDDLRRLVNVYRPFIDDRELPLTKPRFMLSSTGALVLRAAPLRSPADYKRLADHPAIAREFGEHDQWYTPAIYENPLYDVSATARVLSVVGTRVYRKYFGRDRLLDGAQFHAGSTAFRLQVALFERFVREASAAGMEPVLLMLPDLHSLERSRAGHPTPYAPLVDTLRARGLPVLDARLTFDSLASAGASLHAWFMPGGHYSPHGNAVVACLVQRRFAPALADTLATGMRSCVDRILREPDVQRPVAQHHQRPQ